MTKWPPLFRKYEALRAKILACMEDGGLNRKV
jgi:hypothetical protein